MFLLDYMINYDENENNMKNRSPKYGINLLKRRHTIHTSIQNLTRLGNKQHLSNI